MKSNWLPVFCLVAVVGGFPLISLGHIEYTDPKLGTASFFTKFSMLPPNEIGDTLAGIFGSLAFLAAIAALIMQSAELSAQRQELSRQADESQKRNEFLHQQSVENSIFEMLRTHNQVVNGLDLLAKDDGRPVATGRDCFSSFYKTMSRAYRKKRKGHDDEVARFYASTVLWNEHGNDLGHYFRLLYNSFRFISETDKELQYKYGRLFRAQLSDPELLLIYYNCLSEKGKTFLNYAVEFEIFDNLPVSKILDQSHLTLVPRAAFGGNDLHETSQNTKGSSQAPKAVKKERRP
ncbi:MAG: putative phage abortive infection protein [Pseudomonadota bacterium]